MTRRYILGGISRRGTYRCKATDAEILAAWNRLGGFDDDGKPTGLSEVAAAVGLVRPTVIDRLRKLRVLPPSQGTTNHPAPATTERECLKCSGVFNSEGRGNRLCPTCKTQSDPMPGFTAEAWV